MSPITHDTDKTLFARIARGDQDAFTAIFNRYTPRLFPFVSNLINSEAWAEEIVQDIFLRLWQSREGLKNVDSPPAFLYQMASNRTLDYIRVNARQVKLQYYVARIQAAAGNSFTENEVDFREAARLIHQAVGQMPPQRRLVYELAREKGLSHDEIARQLGISHHTVRNHMTEALRFLRAYLEEHGDFIPLVLLVLKKIL